MNKIIIVLLTIFLHQLVSSQGMMSKIADNYYYNWDYYKAFECYDKLATQHMKGKRKNWEEVRKAAYTSMYIRNYKKSLDWFDYLDKNNQLTEEDYLNYFNILCLNKQYEKAVEVGKKLNTNYPSNYKGILISKNPNFYKEITETNFSSSISSVSFNSKNGGDFCPTFYENGIVFSSSRKNNAFIQGRFGWDNTYYTDFYIAPYRSSDKQAFKGAKQFNRKIVNSAFHDATITFNKNYTKAIFSRNEIVKKGNKDVLKIQLYETTKNEKGKWSKPTILNIPTNGYSISHPALNDEGNLLLFVSDMPGGFGGTDIWYSTWENNAWSAPINAGNIINTPGDEMFPTLMSDNKVFFSSNGHLGLGGLDIFLTDLNFSFVENLGQGINSNADDFHLVINTETNIGYFTSDRDNFTDKIYTSKIEIPQFVADIHLIVDNCKNTYLENKKITLKGKNSEKDIEVTSNKNGKALITLPYNSSYEIVLNDENYLLSEESVRNISTKNKTKSEVIPVKLLFYSKNVYLKTLIKDSLSNKVLSKANITVTNLDTEETENISSDDGKLELALNRNYEYLIEISSPGYNKYVYKINLNDKCIDTLSPSVSLTKFKKGDKFILNNIFYDFGKADLRPESLIELDKLANFLIQNSHIKVELSSHTDSRSSDSYNLKLSQKRAESAVKYLISKGVSKDNIIAKGYGEKQLVNRCKNGVQCTEEEHQQNRRTEIKILEVKNN